MKNVRVWSLPIRRYVKCYICYLSKPNTTDKDDDDNSNNGDDDDDDEDYDNIHFTGEDLG